MRELVGNECADSEAKREAIRRERWACYGTQWDNTAGADVGREYAASDEDEDDEDDGDDEEERKDGDGLRFSHWRFLTIWRLRYSCRPRPFTRLQLEQGQSSRKNSLVYICFQRSMSGALLYIKGFINKCAANVNEQQISLTRSSADGGTFLTRIGRCANEN